MSSLQKMNGTIEYAFTYSQSYWFSVGYFSYAQFNSSKSQREYIEV